METTFTPGPWKLNHFEWIGNQRELSISQAEGAPYTNESSDVCNINQQAVSQKTMMANARLIASAPEMHDLLIQCADMAHMVGAYETRNKIRKLLKRIIGEE